MTEIGRTDAVCPYCEAVLPKKPGRKAKCPSCSSFIYVRTRPSDRQRVLVTQTDLARIEAQWESVRQTPSLERCKQRYVGRKEAFERERAALAAKSGKPPPDRDVLWSILSKELIEYSQKRKWGLYRNTRFDMAEVLHAGGQLRAALATYLEVCYLDLNGPNNLWEATDLEIEAKYPPFTPEDFLAPGVLRPARSLVERLGLDRTAVRSLTLDHVQRHCSHLGLPVSPETAWLRIEPELFDGGG